MEYLFFFLDKAELLEPLLNSNEDVSPGMLRYWLSKKLQTGQKLNKSIHTIENQSIVTPQLGVVLKVDAEE
jgi:hypothetical protein